MPFGGLLTVGLISAGTQLAGGFMGRGASRKAAKVQSETARQVADMAVGEKMKGVAESYAGEGSANTTLQNVYNEEKTALSPYLEAGAGATKRLSDMTKPGGTLDSQFSFEPFKFSQDDPGYKFRLEQGQQALERSAAARGQTFSGGTLKELTKYGQDMGSQEYQHAYDRYGQAYNRARQTFDTNRTTALEPLYHLMNAGESATGMYGAAAQNYGNQTSGNDMRGSEYRGNLGMETAQIAGNALTGGANAQAAGVVGGANAMAGGFAGAGQDIMGALLLSKLMNPAGAAGGGGGDASNYGSASNPYTGG